MAKLNYATDGLCHNANHGSFNHECGKPATWIGTNKRTGFRSGYCDHCKQYGDEARACDRAAWVRIATQADIEFCGNQFIARSSAGNDFLAKIFAGIDRDLSPPEMVAIFDRAMASGLVVLSRR